MLYLLALFASLSDPRWEVREDASDALTRLVSRQPEVYGPRLEQWSRTCSCPETRARALRALKPYHRWYVNEFVPSGVPVWPICDAYPVPCPVLPAFAMVDVRDRYYWPVQHVGDGKGGPVWTAYRRTTEQRVRDMLRAGATREEVDTLVSRMWVLERRAKSDFPAAEVDWGIKWTGYP